MKEINQDQRKEGQSKENQSHVEDKNKISRQEEVRQGSDKFGENRDNQAVRDTWEQDKQNINREQNKEDKNR